MRRIPRIVIIISCAAIVAAAGALTAIWLTGNNATALPKATCGSAVTHGVDADTQVLAADPGALTCFGVAARGCRSASLEVNEIGVDTGTTYVFTIERGGMACQVTELNQYYSANGGGSTGPVNTVTCRTIAVAGRGVTLTCGGQDVLIPSTVSRIPPAGA